MFFEEQKEYAAAIPFAERLVALDPLSESHHQLLIRLYAANRDRSSALRAYHQCKRILRREMGVDPGAATLELFERILKADAGTSGDPTSATPVAKPASHLQKVRALIGRTMEWNQLTSAWQSAVEEGPRVAVISGEPGIGKTRLADELYEACVRQGHAAARSRCYAGQGQLAYAPVAEWLLGSPAYALSCGDTVSGHVVLTADLNCSGPGLVVVSDGTKIDLNGHKISCTNGFADAYQGSCQKSHTTQAQSIIGIASTGHNDVQVRGPGVIDGFGVGIRLVNGTGLQVRDVNLTGPASPNASLNDRVGAVGVLIANTVCPDSAVIQDNDISNHTMGIQLSSAFCVVVKDNAIHDNNGVFGDSHGIDLIASGNNTIMKNAVTENGVNRGAPSGGIDGGIMLRTGSANNLVKQNTVSNNCGDGITTNNLAHDNVIQQNTARFNSTSTLSGQCDGVGLGTYFDLAQRSVNASTWDPNNVCRTQNAAVPAGVCGPAE